MVCDQAITDQDLLKILSQPSLILSRVGRAFLGEASNTHFVKHRLASIRSISTMASTKGLIFRQLFEKTSSTYSYLLADEETKEGILIDPVVETAERDAGEQSFTYVAHQQALMTLLYSLWLDPAFATPMRCVPCIFLRLRRRFLFFAKFAR